MDPDTLPQVQEENRNMLMSVHKAGKVSKEKKKKATLLMDFQKELKKLGVTDFWQKKVTCRLNVLPPSREGGMREQHNFFFLNTRGNIIYYHTICTVVNPTE